jgi:hypothetical protein
VKPFQDLLVPRSPPSADTPVCCDVLGFGALWVTPDMLPALRQKPGPLPGEPLPASFFKHADEQTVAGLAAVSQAIHTHGLGETRFTDWGILAAPRFLARTLLAVALHRFQLEGAWGISPHLIPHHSLHAVSGTVSQALKVHGPNFGVGGGPSAADEALLAAAALLAGERVPGVWLLLTGHHPEPIPEEPGVPPNGNGHAKPVPAIGAVALALTLARPGRQPLQLRVVPGPVPEDAGRADGLIEADPFFRLEALLETLTQPSPAGSWRLHCGGRVELTRYGAGAENRS